MGKALVVRNKEAGTLGLLGSFSNRWRDYDFHADPEHGGEIIASKAHKEYEKWLDKNTQHAPELWTWHVWGTQRKSRATWWAFTDNAFYAYWPLTEEEAKEIETWSAEEDLAMSFGFYALEYDDKVAAIDRYRAFEASIVPRRFAANKWTTIRMVGEPEDTGEETPGELVARLWEDEKSTKGEIAMPMSKLKFERLAKLHGEDFAQALVDGDAKIAEELDGAGFDTKEVAVAPEAPEAETVVETIAAEAIATPVVEEVAAPEPVVPEAAAPVAKDEGEAVADAPPTLTPEEIIEALEKLQGAFAQDLRTVVESMQQEHEKAAGEREAFGARLSAIEEKLSAFMRGEEEAAKVAAAPVSVLQGWMPTSILGGSETKTPVKAKPVEDTSSAVVDGRSALAKQGPRAEAEPVNWMQALVSDVRR